MEVRILSGLPPFSGAIVIVDVDAVRAEAFNQITHLPEFARNVIELLEELEKSRLHVAALQELRDDDGKIIQGLVDYFKLADELCTTVDKFMEGVVAEDDVIQALSAWKRSGREVKV